MTDRINADLPDSIWRTLSEEAQEVYNQAYTASWDTYSPSVQRTMDRGAIAHRDAWETVLKEFEQDTDTGQWYRRGQKPVKQPVKGGFLNRVRGALRR